MHVDTWQAGYSGKCTVGLDVAASEFKVKDTPSGAGAMYDLGMWDEVKDPKQMMSSAELMEFYQVELLMIIIIIIAYERVIIHY